MTLLRIGLVLGLFATVAAGCDGCQPTALPVAPAECDADGKGCLSDEFCDQGTCRPFPTCEADDECPTPAWTCVFPAQVCELRAGFGEECVETTDCEPGQFCALGRCRALDEARQCARRSDCPLGQTCDQRTFVCIEEGPCTLADTFPELACGSGETCDGLSERCVLECQNECSVETEEEDCGIGNRCDGACRCVQCITNDDCGPGLLCNVRAGRCESEDLCFSDDDCDAPLICDPSTALCQVAPPPCEDDLDCEIAEICNRVTGVCELPGGACRDDRFENADTPATAEPVRLPETAEIVLYDELQLCPDDDDVYRVDLLPGDQLIVRIFGTTPAARATLWLLDGEGETSLRFAEAPPFGNGTVAYRAQVDGPVFIRVNALVGPSPYDMEIVRSFGEPCAPDPYEGEPIDEGDAGPAAGGNNDRFDRATPPDRVPLDVPFEAELCPDDVDHLGVSLLAGEGIEASLRFDETTLDLDLAVVDAVTGVVLQRAGGLAMPEVVRLRSPRDREVAVRVSGFGNAAGPYSLQIDRLPVVDCAVDAFEPDDDPDAAAALSLGQTLPEVERSLCAGDVDTYRVAVEDFERLIVRAQFPAAEMDLRLEVYDAAGEELLAASPNSGDIETLVFPARATEEVLVRVRSLFNTQGTYRLEIERENQGGCTPDELEPNDNVAGAEDLGAERAELALSLCGPDEDYFRVDGVAGKQLRAVATFLHGEADIDLQILNFDGRDILDSADGVDDREEAEALLPLDGPYFIRVFSLQGASARTPYSLVVEQVTP